MNSNSLFTTVFKNFQWLRRKRGYWPTTYLQHAQEHLQLLSLFTADACSCLVCCMMMPASSKWLSMAPCNLRFACTSLPVQRQHATRCEEQRLQQCSHAEHAAAATGHKQHEGHGMERSGAA